MILLFHWTVRHSLADTRYFVYKYTLHITKKDVTEHLPSASASKNKPLEQADNNQNNYDPC